MFRRAGSGRDAKSMRQNKLGKITASVILEINQLERLNELAYHSGVSRSTIVRDAIDHELERYEKDPLLRKVGSTPQEGDAAASKTYPPRP
jgi:predicted DNA-binding protein